MPRHGNACSTPPRKLNYAPNQSGRNLRRGATQSIAFMLQPHPGDQQYGEPFFIPFLTGLQAKLAEYGLDLMVVMGAPGDYQQERLRRVVETRRADAVVLAATRREDDRIDYLIQAGFPFATLGRSLSGGRSYPSLDLDFEKAGSDAVDRLASRGHTRIAAVRPSHNLNFGYLFMAGYRKALKRHGIDFDPELTAAGLINESGGYAVTPDLMRAKKPPTAIIFNNDAMALGGCRALVEMGWSLARTWQSSSSSTQRSAAITHRRSLPSARRWSRSAGGWGRCCLPSCPLSLAPRARKSSAKSGRWNSLFVTATRRTALTVCGLEARQRTDSNAR